MSKIEFTKAELEAMVTKLQVYFSNELDQEIGQFETEFLIDFFSKEIGPYYYNRGLHDARLLFQSKIESIDDELYAIEKVI